MIMPSHRINEWYQFILRNAGGDPFVCVGDFPNDLARKFASIGMSYRQVASVDNLDSSCNGIAWIVDGINENDAISKLAAAAKEHKPSRIYFELSPEAVKGLRPAIERAFFESGYRKHPNYHLYVEFSDSCYWNRQYIFERTPEACLDGFSNQHGLNQKEAGLHRDMLRDSDRRADAHTMRYHWASQYIHFHDVVLDAACGLGYGSSILAHNSQCSKVIGLDKSDYAIDYAWSAYGSVSNQLEFSACDVTNLGHIKDNTIHDVVSFETLEHLEDPAPFLRECKRVLIPGGRFICSVPNNWADETGKDPNPYHFQVYTKEKLIRQLSEFFIVEHVYSQKAGDGFRKFPENVRVLSEVDKSTPEEEAEWWLVVGMKDPVGAPKTGFKAHYYPQMEVAGSNIGAFERDYENPWMVYSSVIPGVRTSSKEVLLDLSNRNLKRATPASPDRGAMLCVLGYQYLETGNRTELEKVTRDIEEYLTHKASTPHQLRWTISLRFLLGRIFMELGDNATAKKYFLDCANEDCLKFGPTLGTKTVEALFLHGWLLYLEKKIPAAMESWKRGVFESERILKTSGWNELRGREDLPFDWGFVEAMVILQKAQQCAFAIYAINSGIYEHDQLDFEIIYSSTRKNCINSGHIEYLNSHIQSLVAHIQNQAKHIQGLTNNNQTLTENNLALTEQIQSLSREKETGLEKISHLQSENDAGVKVVADLKTYIKILEGDLEKKNLIIQKLRGKVSVSQTT